MPSFPEINDVNGLVRRIEVDRDLDSKHPADPPGHVAVSAEIKIQLQRIAQNDHHRIRPAKRRQAGIAEIHTRPESVRQQHLFCQTDDKKAKTPGNLLPLHRFLPQTVKLRQHLGMIDDRPRDQLRKEGHKQRICDERTVLHLSLVRVHNKGNLLEGEKADPQRQQNPPQRRRRAKHRIDGRQEKIEILEIEQHAQVGRHCRCHQRF